MELCLLIRGIDEALLGAHLAESLFAGCPCRVGFATIDVHASFPGKSGGLRAVPRVTVGQSAME